MSYMYTRLENRLKWINGQIEEGKIVYQQEKDELLGYLDVMYDVIYGSPESITVFDGPRILAAQHYYNNLPDSVAIPN